MEDWEEFFAEKSRRRAGVERRRDRRERLVILAGMLLVAILIGIAFYLVD